MIADCIWGLYRQSGKSEARLAIAGKDVEEQELVLQFDPETGCWRNAGKSGAIKLTAQRKQLLDALQDLGAATLTEIARAAGADKGNTSRRLADLEAAGLVRRVSLSGTTLYQLAGVWDAAMAGAAP